MHLTLNGCVACRLKMLTYYRVCCVFSSACALPLNVTYYFLDNLKHDDEPEKSVTNHPL